MLLRIMAAAIGLWAAVPSANCQSDTDTRNTSWEACFEAHAHAFALYAKDAPEFLESLAKALASAQDYQSRFFRTKEDRERPGYAKILYVLAQDDALLGDKNTARTLFRQCISNRHAARVQVDGVDVRTLSLEWIDWLDGKRSSNGLATRTIEWGGATNSHGGFRFEYGSIRSLEILPRELASLPSNYPYTLSKLPAGFDLGHPQAEFWLRPQTLTEPTFMETSVISTTLVKRNGVSVADVRISQSDGGSARSLVHLFYERGAPTDESYSPWENAFECLYKDFLWNRWRDELRVGTPP
jgi:hypothetical protein